MEPRTFFVYLDEKRLVTSFLSGVSINNPVFFANDAEPTRFVFLRRSTLGRTYDVVDPPASLKVGIGAISKPVSGTWIADYDGDQTSALPFDISASALETALNALTSVASGGGVSVTGPDGGPWKITWTNTGARVDFTFDAGGLSPDSHVVFHETTEGDGSTASVSTIRLAQLPAAFQDTWTAISAPGITITEETKGAAGTNEVQRIAIDPLPYDGSFSLTYGGQTTAAIDYNATASSVKEALEALSNIEVGDVSVTKLGAGTWDVQFTGNLAGTDVAMMTANGGSLVGYVGLEASLNLATPGIAALLANLSEKTLTLEIEATQSTNRRTQIQINALVKNDLIDGQPLTPPSFARSYSQDEADLRFPLLRMDITGLVGGAATDLDSVNLTDVPENTVYLTRVTPGANVPGICWRVEESTDAHDPAGGTVRPDNYASLGTKKVFKLLF